MDEIVILVHGFLANLTSSTWMEEYKDKLLALGGRAVLRVGWGHGSGNQASEGIRYYWQAAANARYMGALLARVVQAIEERVTILSNNVHYLLHTHCIGHSLGAHVCGFTGRALRNISHLYLSRISGLDPAGPMFTNDVPSPFNYYNITPEARLNKDDAEFVDIIHTDGKPR